MPSAPQPLSPTMPIQSAHQPLNPTVFMPGFPKSATTWLYQCLLSTFDPETVCASSSAQHWSMPRCRNRFLLPTLSTNSLGDARFMKEPFAFGGTGAPPIVGEAASLTNLHGPDPRSGPTTARLPALWPWERNEVRKERWKHADGSAAGAREHAHRIAEVCGFGAADGEEAGLHPSCQRVRPGTERGWACKWDGRLQTQLNRSTGHCVRSMAPWLTPGEANATLIDFTPNYLCDGAAMRRIHASARTPSALRFVVVVRDPVMRAFSEFAMFRWGYFWEPSTANFTHVAAQQVAHLQACNRSLFRNASALRALPTAELEHYLRRCFGAGRAMMYVPSSAAAVCILHALRLFDVHQFLFLRYEDLVGMSAQRIVARLGRFLGLHVDEHVVQLAARRGCEPASSRRSQSFVARGPTANLELASMTPSHEWLYAPYDELLQQLVGRRFRWTRKTHQLAPLTADERARRAALLDEIVAKRTARIRRQREDRRRQKEEAAQQSRPLARPRARQRGR